MEVHSISEGLGVTINLLNSINLPISKIRDVGTKILAAVDNLNTIKMIVDAAENDKKEEGPENGVQHD